MWLQMYTFPHFLFSVTKWVSGEEKEVEARRGGDTAVEHGTIGAL